MGRVKFILGFLLLSTLIFSVEDIQKTSMENRIMRLEDRLEEKDQEIKDLSVKLEEQFDLIKSYEATKVSLDSKIIANASLNYNVDQFYNSAWNKLHNETESKINILITLMVGVMSLIGIIAIIPTIQFREIGKVQNLISNQEKELEKTKQNIENQESKIKEQNYKIETNLIKGDILYVQGAFENIKSLGSNEVEKSVIAGFAEYELSLIEGILYYDLDLDYKKVTSISYLVQILELDNIVKSSLGKEKILEIYKGTFKYNHDAKEYIYKKLEEFKTVQNKETSYYFGKIDGKTRIDILLDIFS